MPRGSGGSSSKRQGLHSHSNTHNGLIPPKRPNRSRSSSSVSAFTIAPTNQPLAQEISTAAAQFHSSANGVANTDTNGWHGKDQRFYDCLGDEGDSFGEGVNGIMSEHHKIDFNPSGERSDMFPSTVLSSFPLLDTITLLIIFLQVPPTILTVVHFLFFLQTFVPPSTTLFSVSTTASMPSFTNLLLQGSNGSPSLLTIMFADCVLASISLFLWPSAWNFLVEFAQAIIAMTLGAGNSTGSSLRNVAVCAGVMGGVKVVQGRFRLSDAWDSIQPARQQKVSHMLSGRVGGAGWIRTFFAIHIVAQAAMKATRRWLIRRPEALDASSGSLSANPKDISVKQKDKDPEAGVGAPPPMLERDNAAAGGKRKKKNQVQSIRNNQPLWATVASAVIHVAKEVERTQISSAASNTNAGNVGTASNDSTSDGEDSSVWITKIGSTEVGFVVGLIRGMKDEDGYGYVENGGIDATGRDSSFPFFVRVNGIVWPQTEICQLGISEVQDLGEGDGDVETRKEDEWAVEVTGLTGSTEYDFEFVKRGGAVFYSTSACTLPAQASAIPSVKHQPSRPLSPITTLLHSLAQASSCLTETKSNLKSIRKAHKTGLSEIRKEIEKHRGLIGNDRGEERAFRRNLALRESVKRAEEETEEMSKKLADLQHRPENMKPEWETKKKEWQAEKRRLSASLAKAAEEKAKADRKATAVETEVISLSAKKEKLTARLTKLRVDLGKLDSENSEGSDTREKKQAEREASEKYRKSLEREYLEAIHRLETRINEYSIRSHDNWSTYYALESVALQQAATEIPMPGSARGSGTLILPPGMIPHESHLAHMHSSNRERSSSTFSDGSVITNLSELGNSSFVPAFEPIPSRHGSVEYIPSHVAAAMIGRGKGAE